MQQWLLGDELHLRNETCRFFPSVYYMASSKVAIATFGNLAFAMALCLYRLVTRVRAHLRALHAFEIVELHSLLTLRVSKQ